MSEQVPTWEQPTGQYRITAELVAEWADAKTNGAMMLYHSADSAASHCKGVAAFVRMQEAKLEIHARRLKALEHRHRRGCIEAAQCRDNDFGGRYGEGMRDAGTHVLMELEGDHE